MATSPFTRRSLGLCGLAVILAACSGSKGPAAGEAGKAAAAAQSEAGPAQSAIAGVVVAKVAQHTLAAQLELVGSVTYNPDRVARVGPLVAGRVAALAAKSGTAVRRGELLAEIESPEAGQAMAQFITAGAHARAALAQFKREQDLAQKHISSARDLDVAEAQAAQAEAELQAAGQLLQALGLEPPRLHPKPGEAKPGRVPLRSPIDGVVVNRYVALGQAVERATDAFLVADLTALWVELEIYEKDLGRVHVGQAVELSTESWPGRIFAAKVAYVEPVVNVKSRTTNMRLELDNPNEALRPGQFVTARLGPPGDGVVVPVLAVERAALQHVDGHEVVFVATGNTFEPRRVSLGLYDERFVEVTHGLVAGEQVAVRGAFLLKANLAAR